MAVVGTFVLMAGYAALLPMVGFMITTAVYLFLQINILAENQHRKPVLFGIISVVTSVSVYYLFVMVFHLMLPAGILG
jgi:putative tricarboxylic transport membrane protein